MKQPTAVGRNRSFARPLAVGVALLAALTAPRCGLAQRSEPGVPEVCLPWMKVAPQIDGRIDEEQWRGAVRNVGFISHRTHTATTREGTFWIGSDGKSLFLALKTELPPDGHVLVRAVPDGSRDIAAVLLDDGVELVVDPLRGRAAGQLRRFYHLIANGRGALYDWAVDPDNRQNAVDMTWRLSRWQMAQQAVDGWWHVEIALPLDALGVTQSDWQRAWGLQIARNWKRPAEQSEWSSDATSYDSQATLPLVRWDQTAPVVRVLSLVENERPKLRVGIFNPHAAPATVAVRLSDAWHRDPAVELTREVTVAPGREEIVSLDGRDSGPEGLHNTLIHVASPDGNRVYYHRGWRWTLRRPESVWSIGEEQRQAVDVQFKYYPYEHKIAFRVSTEALAVRERVSAASAFITKADAAGKPAGSPLWQAPVVLRNHQAEQIVEIPELAAGSYFFGVKLAGGPGVPPEPILERFERRLFEWECNPLGISDEIMPPFTPLTAVDKTVSAVLRRHEHGRSGLWEQVTSAGRPLLAAPMAWEIVAAESGRQLQDCQVESSSWAAQDVRPNRITGTTTWTAGPLRGRVLTQYDYDGMLLATLEFEPAAPAGSAELKHLDLVIPLRGDVARYMHASGDGLRFNYAGFLPAGQGRIWDSGKASKSEIVGTFYPYLWVGDGERGLCWFADTDRDWILDEQTPTLDLTRQGDAVTLRVHFVTQPGRLDHRHRIVFGLQATPTKPMPEGWRRWTASKPIEGGRCVRWLGACFYWGGASYDVYPLEHQFDFYEKLREARLSGHIDEDYMRQFMALIERRGDAKGSPGYQHWLNHIRAGFHTAKASPWSQDVRLFPYTNPRGAGFHVPEFAVFQDEWLRYRYFNRNWKPSGDVGYDIHPSRSFQDYCLWYYRKMLTCFDGVYWDNVFLAANFDPVVGQAWVDARGRIHPTMGLFALRDLMKRTAVMLWQESRALPAERRPPITLAHMTNALLVPAMSFVNCTMDWEWKYGYDDFQDRFAPDLTVAETIGRQVGAWPTILAGGHWDPKDPRVEPMLRTRLGVTLVHEIQPFDGPRPKEIELYRRLFEFGYGDAGTRVFNYWQPQPPLSLSGADARWLALAGPRGVLVVVIDYGHGGDCRVRLDLAALGLKPEAAAVDFETGQSIDRLAPGEFLVPLKQHDFRILHAR